MVFSKDLPTQERGEEKNRIGSTAIKMEAGLSVPVGGEQEKMIWEGESSVDSVKVDNGTSNGRPGDEPIWSCGTGVTNGGFTDTKVPMGPGSSPGNGSSGGNGVESAPESRNGGLPLVSGDEDGRIAARGPFNSPAYPSHGSPWFFGNGNSPTSPPLALPTSSVSPNGASLLASEEEPNGLQGNLSLKLGSPPRLDNRRKAPYDRSERSAGMRRSYTPTAQSDPNGSPKSSRGSSFSGDRRSRWDSPVPIYGGGIPGRNASRRSTRLSGIDRSEGGDNRPPSSPNPEVEIEPFAELVNRLKERMARGGIVDEPYVPASVRDTEEYGYTPTPLSQLSDISSDSSIGEGGEQVREKPRKQYHCYYTVAGAAMLASLRKTEAGSAGTSSSSNGGAPSHARRERPSRWDSMERAIRVERHPAVQEIDWFNELLYYHPEASKQFPGFDSYGNLDWMGVLTSFIPPSHLHVWRRPSAREGESYARRSVRPGGRGKGIDPAFVATWEAGRVEHKARSRYSPYYWDSETTSRGSRSRTRSENSGSGNSSDSSEHLYTWPGKFYGSGRRASLSSNNEDTHRLLSVRTEISEPCMPVQLDELPMLNTVVKPPSDPNEESEEDA